MTHVVSVVSADKRQLPTFIKAHYHALVDDREEAAVEMAGHFERICSFVSRALQSGGTCYIHCGAGISRAPTAACAYLVYAHRLRAADALVLVRHGRPCARPNVGFVRALHDWEKLVRASAPAFHSNEGTQLEVFGSSRGPLEKPRGSVPPRTLSRQDCSRSASTLLDELAAGGSTRTTGTACVVTLKSK